MNWRRLIVGIIVLIVLVLTGLGAWSFFASKNSVTPQESPTPTIIDTIGALPVASPTSLPTPTSQTNPIGFRGVCPDTWVSQQDTDGDGLPDSVEVVYGTDPDMPDTDSDQYSDGQEIRAGYDPLNKVSSARLDSDHDALFDNDECKWHIDPFNTDSDGDSFKDGAEVANGFDPAKKGDGNGSDKITQPSPAPVVSSAPQSSAIPTPYVSTQPQQTSSAVSIALIPVSQLHIVSQSAPSDVKAYLTSLDALRPQELTDGQAITDAIKSAASGNVQPLTAARSRIQQFSTALKGVSVPSAAQEYHQLYVSLMDFTAARLQTIEQNAVSDQQKAAAALLEIQNTLPQYITRLASLRQAVETVANR